MEMTKLSELMGMLHIDCEDEREILGICDHSGHVKKDEIYVCWRVLEEKKQSYIKQALSKGAVVLCDKEKPGKDIYVCECVEDIAQALIELYYGDLCKDIFVAGVSGTNGKTSVTSYLSQMLHICGKEVMRIGTGQVTFLDQIIPISNTTPDCFELAQLFHTANMLGLDGVVMEVSSHAIDQNRINFIQYDIIIYITQDHLDYHLTKTHYRFTKFKLRRYLKTDGLIIYQKDLKEMRDFAYLYHGASLTIGMRDAHMVLENIQLSDHDAAFIFDHIPYHTHLLGMFNVYNIASVIAAGRRLNIEVSLMQKACEQIKAVAGRMEVLKGKGYHIWIDFAHTPDALLNLLQFAQSVKRRNIITIIGCGGDRDKTKRAFMADIARTYSDIAIFTSDNPRGEEIHEILYDMCTNAGEHVEIFENRSFAIKHAVKCARNSDIIIIAGKGNEDYQMIQHHYYPFSDRDIVKKRLCEEENH